MRSGIVFALLAYGCWGVYPIYYRALHHVATSEIVLHRIVWSLVFVLVIMAWRQQWRWLRLLRDDPGQVGRFVLATLVLTGNWSVFIWAQTHDRVIDASLGYFINPLVNVLVGALVLQERQRQGQWLAVGVAAAGVLWLTVSTGTLPWIGLALAGLWAMYGYLRKTASLGALDGLAFETMLAFPFAAGLLIVLGLQGQSSFVSGSLSTQALLVAAGPLTAVPLLLFAAGARRIPFALLGLLQYIAPTLQLMIGYWLFNEPFGRDKLIGFVLIWIALAMYSAESVWHGRRSALRPAA